MKKLFTFLVVLSLLLSFPGLASAEEPSISDERILCERTVLYDSNGEILGEDVVLTNVTVLPDGCFCVTREGKEEISRLAEPEMRVTKNFVNSYYDRNGVFLASQTVTVVGYYSSTNGVADITSISDSFTGTYASYFSSSKSWGGSSGSVSVYFSSSWLMSYSYTLTTTGHITQS